MPSDCIVPVVEIRNVRVHPGADMLSIAEVLGYQVVNGLVEDPEGEIVRTFVKDARDERGRRVPLPTDPEAGVVETEEVRFSFRYKEGERAVYFASDTVLTDEWVQTYEVDHLVKEGNRVGRCRLRGEASFGLVGEIPEGQDWELGQNVAAFYEATKWEPPADKMTAADAAAYDSEIDPHFVKYTDIQNGLLLYEKFQEGEEVVATEKIHGKNARIGLVNGVLQVGSRTYRKDARGGDIFHDVAADPQILDLLQRVVAERNAKTVILYGEIFGQGVQSLRHLRRWRVPRL